MRIIHRFFIVLVALTPLLAQAAAPSDLVRASLLADASAIAPGSSFTLGVHLKIKALWHVYWANPGETGTATEIKMSGPAGFTFGAVQWPIPAKLNTEAGLSYAYEDEVLLLIPVRISKDVAADEVTLTANVRWLACHDTCIEGKANLSIKLPVKQQATATNQDLFAKWDARLPNTSDSAAARKLIAKKEQPAPPVNDGAKAQPAVTVTWHAVPAKIDWYPLATPAVMIEDVKVEQAGATTVIRFKPTIYKADDVPGGLVDGVLVYEDAKGTRQGIFCSVVIALPK